MGPPTSLAILFVRKGVMALQAFPMSTSTVALEETFTYEGCAHASRLILKGESKGKIQRPFRSSQTGAFHFAK